MEAVFNFTIWQYQPGTKPNAFRRFQHILTAMSVDGSGQLFLFRMDSPSFLSYAHLTHLQQPQEILYTVTNKHLLEEIMQRNDKYSIGISFHKITNIVKKRDYVQIHFTYLPPDSKFQVSETVEIFNDMPNFDELLQCCERFMRTIRNVCSRCGHDLQNGFCINCLCQIPKKPQPFLLSPDVSDAVRKKKTLSFWFMILTVLSNICLVYTIVQSLPAILSYLCVGAVFLFLGLSTCFSADANRIAARLQPPNRQ